MTSKEQVIKSIEDWYQPVKIRELIHERKNAMNTNQDKILIKLSTTMRDIRRRNKGRGKKDNAIKTIDITIQKLRLLNCDNKIIQLFLDARKRIENNGINTFNKMSLYKVFEEAKTVYKNKYLKGKRKISKPSETPVELNKLIDPYIASCQREIEVRKLELESLEQKIKTIKNELDDLDHKKQYLIDRNNDTTNAMLHYAAFHKITL